LAIVGQAGLSDRSGFGRTHGSAVGTVGRWSCARRRRSRASTAPGSAWAGGMGDTRPVWRTSAGRRLSGPGAWSLRC